MQSEEEGAEERRTGEEGEVAALCILTAFKLDASGNGCDNVICMAATHKLSFFCEATIKTDRHAAGRT